MQRGELYRGTPIAAADPRQFRIFLAVSRAGLINSRYRSVICAPVYTHAAGISSELPLGPAHGLKHASVARCDELTAVPRSRLGRYVGTLSEADFIRLDHALLAALEIRHFPAGE